VFTRAGSGWSQQAYVKASNTDLGDEFGGAVALSADGSTLAVGAHGERSTATGINGDQTDNSGFFVGAVYVYARTGSSWSQEAYIKAATAEQTLQFGATVALSADGSTLAVGASGESADATDVSGAVYVFTRSAGTWSQQARVRLRQGQGHGGGLGTAVALSADGSTIAAMAGSDVVDDAVFIYSRVGDAWSDPAQVNASNAFQGNLFGLGLSLSSDGSVLAAGAQGEWSNATGINGDQHQDIYTGAQDSGAVYVYARDQGVWSQQAYVKASDSEAGWLFGSAVALTSDGSTLIVGAPGARGPRSVGSVYAYTRAGTTWSEQARVHPGDRPEFGDSVASSSDGSVVAIGTAYDAVHVYLGGLAAAR